MIVKKSSRVKSSGRNVTPLRAAPSCSNFQTHGSKRSRGRQLSGLQGYGCNKDSCRAVPAGVRCVTGGCRTDHGEGTSTARVSEDLSHDSTSLSLPSGVSSFLLECLDVDSPTSDDTLSSIEEFRKADNYDDGSGWRVEEALMTGVKNSTLLDLSHAQDLALQPTPNLSSIIELSLDPEEGEEELFPLPAVSLSPVRVSSQTPASDMASVAELRSAQETTPVNTRPVAPYPAVRKCFAEKRKLLKCRKVTFSDIVSVRNVSSHKCVQVELRDQRENRDHPDGSVSSDNPVRFFDFADAREREAFFHRLKQTHSFTFPAKPILSSS
ncbi:hypothetical protein R3I94_015880 [Phoxinus phoxinus]